ncbi:MAG TPA: efflux RND transporter periplasmic adaptor subunit [Polyangiaceae bacterium]|nr:efflux RND transporter periplasmic adaptor subunit [Polyangiaceae bacterium]
MKTSRIIWIAVLLLVIGAGGAYWRYRWLHRAPEVEYKTAPVERRHIIGRITASGTLSAIVTVQVGTQVSGRVSKLNADFNSPVKKGDVVAKIDPQLFEASVQQAQANLMSAQAGVATAAANAVNADKQYARTKALHDQNLAAQSDLDTAEANVAVSHAAIDNAKASLAQAVASLHQAQVNLSYTNIVSPIDGVVISRAVDVGQTVAASLSTPTLFTIAQDLTKMQVDTNVAEGDVGRLEVGMRAFFTVDSFPGQRFVGKIRQIRNSATTLQNVVTYDAVIDVDNVDLRLRPGMTANVTVVYAERPHVLSVPNAALRFRPPASLSGGTGTAAGTASREGSGEGTHRRRAQAEGQGGGENTDGGTGGDNGGSATGGGAGGGGQGQGHGGGQGRGGWQGRGGGNGGGDASEGRTLWVMRGGSPQAVTVHAGLTDGTNTEIVDGDLAEGDSVVVESTSPDAPAAAPSGGMPSMRRMF